MSTPERCAAATARALLPQLAALLQDAVDHGASVGFFRPLAAADAESYWRDVMEEVAVGRRILLVTRADSAVVASAQLSLCQRPNARHCAEVQKLLVHSRTRRRGLGRALMVAIDAEARTAGRTLLYLDTEPGQPAEAMYRSLGWSPAGFIPGYACNPDGQLNDTMIFYRSVPV